MANVKELTERLVKKEEELMNGSISLMNFKAIASMDAKEFELLKSVYEFINTTNELMVAYAEVMDDMNAKLDCIVSEKNKQA